MSQDMSLFKVKSKNKSGLGKIILPIALALMLMYGVGLYALDIARALEPSGATYVVLEIFVVFASILTLVEAVYKSQGILFDAKDNDLLFSLPITKPRILFVRLVKMIIFQTLYSALFVIPAMVAYAMCVQPGVEFFAVSILMLILLPLLPTIVGCTVGYLIELVASKSKARNIVQVILSVVMLSAILYLSFDTQGAMANIAQNVSSINGALTAVYYPAGLYAQLVQHFNALDLLTLLCINIVPTVLFVYVASVFYFKIISRLSGKVATKVKNAKGEWKKFEVKKPISALAYKELKRFFSSPVYIINAGFGLLLMVVITVLLSFNLEGIIGTMAKESEMPVSMEGVRQMVAKIFYCLVVVVGCTTSISSSMISIEGKSFNITKSLPVSTPKILLAKILACDLVIVPVILICDVIFFVAFKVGMPDMLFILLASLLVPTFTAMVGLMMNLKYPKMNASSDTEVVKQSMSSMLSVFSGMLMAALAVGAVIVGGTGEDANSNLAIALELVVFGVIDLILWVCLKKYGTKRFKEINA